ncbi:MAG: RagB/SusD family nutrient uptake outer membrane protein [Bacteroidaceae bacterium]|nr:RagB/SusD family nutrient uptake outer membrane protein [Bacteroidaceae bacterium]
MTIKKINISLVAALALTMTSCNSFLDKLPDDRAEVNSVEKIKNLLISAYPDHSTAFLMEYSSDNVTDNGDNYTAQPNQDKVYRFQQVTETGNDDPKSVWQSTYSKVATANEALAGIALVGENSSTLPLKAEALLCRAYAIFQITNAFCMAYDPTKADEYLGLPYPKSAGEYVTSRGTLAETYKNINADIEEALPLLDDSYLKVPAYHFNSKAAYAFAARFNLYYHNYDKAIEYATKALGNNPASVLRDPSTYSSLSGVDNIFNAYINSSDKANLLIVTSYSINGRAMYSPSFARFAHNYAMAKYETFWAYSPWAPGKGGSWPDMNGSTNNTLYEAACLYGNNQTVYYPKFREVFEYTDKVNGTGYAHTVEVAFTTDEALLVRAEAYTMKNDFTSAIADMQLWVNAHTNAKKGTGVRPTLTTELIDSIYGKVIPEAPVDPTEDKMRSTRKKLHPQGFTIAEGTQTNLIQLILQVRRLETWRQGLRFQDVKRWGIEYSHPIDKEETLIFKAGDLRGAIQLPVDVIDAGLEANPR